VRAWSGKKIKTDKIAKDFAVRENPDPFFGVRYS
jgi:hypothetical protein